MSEAPEAAPVEAPAEAPPAPPEDPLMIIADALENGQMPPFQEEPPLEAQEEEPAAAQEEEQQESPPPSDKPAEEEQDRSLASSWKAVKEAEVKNTKERAEIKAELQELRKFREEGGSKYEEIKKAFAENPNEALKHFGVTQDDIVERILNQGQAGPGEQARAVGRAEEAKFDDIRNTLKEQQEAIQQTQGYLQNQRAAEAQTQFASQVTQELKDPEFSLVADHDSIIDDVWNRATSHYQQTGEILTPRESLGKLQTEFRDALKQLASYKSTKAYMEELLGSPGTEQAVGSDKSTTPQEAQGYKPRTLTNSMSAQQPTPQPREEPLTEYEEIMQAAKLITPGS